MAIVLFRSESTTERTQFYALGRGFLVVREESDSEVRKLELLLPPWTSATAIDFGQTAEELKWRNRDHGNLLALLRQGQVQIFELAGNHFRHVTSIALGDNECQSIKFDNSTTLSLSLRTADKRGEDALVDIVTGEIRKTGLFANAIRFAHPSGKWMIRGGLWLELTQPSLLQMDPVHNPKAARKRRIFRSQLRMRPHFDCDPVTLSLSEQCRRSPSL